MKIGIGNGTTKYGPGVSIELSGYELTIAIEAYLVAQNTYISGPRTITVNGELCDNANIYVDPSGFAIYAGRRFDGSG